MKILVGISGGVDSALSALILKEQGHDVVCAMMKIYDGDPLSTLANSCYGINKEQEVSDARLSSGKILANCIKKSDTKLSVSTV